MVSHSFMRGQLPRLCQGVMHASGREWKVPGSCVALGAYVPEICSAYLISGCSGYGLMHYAWVQTVVTGDLTAPGLSDL